MHLQRQWCLGNASWSSFDMYFLISWWQLWLSVCHTEECKNCRSHAIYTGAEVLPQHKLLVLSSWAYLRLLYGPSTLQQLNLNSTITGLFKSLSILKWHPAEAFDWIHAAGSNDQSEFKVCICSSILKLNFITSYLSKTSFQEEAIFKRHAPQER